MLGREVLQLLVESGGQLAARATEGLKPSTGAGKVRDGHSSWPVSPSAPLPAAIGTGAHRTAAAGPRSGRPAVAAVGQLWPLRDHRLYGVNVQVAAVPTGTLLWISPALPGRTHHIRTSGGKCCTQASPKDRMKQPQIMGSMQRHYP